VRVLYNDSKSIKQNKIMRLFVMLEEDSAALRKLNSTSQIKLCISSLKFIVASKTKTQR